MAGTMVHEFTHISLKTGDDAYHCVLRFKDLKGNPKNGARALALALVPGAALLNADSYRCWVEDVGVSWGTPFAENDIRIRPPGR